MFANIAECVVFIGVLAYCYQCLNKTQTTKSVVTCVDYQIVTIYKMLQICRFLKIHNM